MRPKAGENTWLWLAKMLTGAFIIILLFVHLIVNHLVAEGGVMDFAAVLRYVSNPWIALMEMTFLVLVVCHALLGTRSVVLDLRPSPRVLRVVDGLFVTVGLVSIVYGIWLMQTIVRQAGG